MLKTYTITLKQKITVALAFCIAMSVMLAALHLKDIVKVSSVSDYTPASQYKDVTQKASEDLHNHVDKQMVKAFAKTFGDTITASRSRDDDDMFAEDDPGLVGRLTEQLMLWRIFVTMPFSTLA